jgi:hypothetical protein
MRWLLSDVNGSVGEGDGFDEEAAMFVRLRRMVQWKRRWWAKKAAVTSTRKKVALLTLCERGGSVFSLAALSLTYSGTLHACKVLETSELRTVVIVRRKYLCFLSHCTINLARFLLLSFS